MSSSTGSCHTLSALKDKELDTIPFRIEFIKELLKDKIIQPMINLDDPSTENFIMGLKDINNINMGDNESNKTHDTRVLLNKKIYDFYDAISQIGGDLMYVKSGTTGHTFRGVVEGTGESHNYGVKVVAYPKREKYGDINDAKRPENAELLMIKLLSFFVINKQTPHIVLPIGTFNTSIKPFVTIADDSNIIDVNNKKYKAFVTKYKNGEYYNKVSILISEWANRGDLLDFIRKNYMNFKLLHWKALFFQIISVLAVIQYKYPAFRHNDLKANNILIHKTSKTNNKFTYKVVGKTYYVPNIGYQIKLWDFDFACIPGIVDNNKVTSDWTKAINVTPDENRYYDMHYFFNTLIGAGFFPQFMEDNIVPQEAKDFVNRIVPEKYKNNLRYVHKRGRILINDEYLTPDEVLKKDPFFDDFRKPLHTVRGTKKIETTKLNKMDDKLNKIDTSKLNKTNKLNIVDDNNLNKATKLNKGSKKITLDELLMEFTE